MNLQPQAETEQERRTRSKLEAHREAIFALRRKHWSHRQIAKWLNEHGVQITLEFRSSFLPAGNRPPPAQQQSARSR